MGSEAVVSPLIEVTNLPPIESSGNRADGLSVQGVDSNFHLTNTGFGQPTWSRYFAASFKFWDNKHPHLPWQLNSNLFCILIRIFINLSICFYISSKAQHRCIPLSYMNMIFKCRYSNSEARIQFKVNSNIWNTLCPTQMSH